MYKMQALKIRPDCPPSTNFMCLEPQEYCTLFLDPCPWLATLQLPEYKAAFGNFCEALKSLRKIDSFSLVAALCCGRSSFRRGCCSSKKLSLGMWLWERWWKTANVFFSIRYSTSKVDGSSWLMSGGSIKSAKIRNIVSVGLFSRATGSWILTQSGWTLSYIVHKAVIKQRDEGDCVLARVVDLS